MVLWSVSGYRPGLDVDREEVRRLFRFGSGILGMRISFYVGEYTDNFIVGLVLGTRALGFYVVGFRIFRIITEIVTTTIGAVTLPCSRG